MSEQDGKHKTRLQRPTNNDREAWKAHWGLRGQVWRTEPEIDADRQDYLAERRKIKPDIGQGIYSFGGIKLNRADVEWLLATHDNNRGPIDWNDESQRSRKGLDLRGADLREVILYFLPLARMNGAINPDFEAVTQVEAAAIHLEGATLLNAHLEGATLNCAHLEGTYLFNAHLEGATLSEARLEGATLSYAHLEGADLSEAHLEGAILPAAFFDRSTRLNNVSLSNIHYGAASIVDLNWGDVNVAVVDWSTISILGDERRVKKYIRFIDNRNYEPAARAYRQLSVVLRNQGINEDAARFTYRAQRMQRKLFWYQRKFAQYFGSLFLDLLSGYGYKPMRCFIAYLIVIASFALAYFIIGHKVGPVLSPLGSVVFSMTSFHGRGFFPGGIALDDPLTVLAALEAFIGLLIEVTFIATLTRRFFSQ